MTDLDVNTNEGFEAALKASAAQSTEEPPAEGRRDRPDTDSPLRVIKDVLGGEAEAPTIRKGLTMEGDVEPEVDYSDPAVQRDLIKKTDELLGQDFKPAAERRAQAAEGTAAEQLFHRIREDGASDDDLAEAGAYWHGRNPEGLRDYLAELHAQELDERSEWLDEDEQYGEKMNEPTEAQLLAQQIADQLNAEQHQALGAELLDKRTQLAAAEEDLRGKALEELLAGVPDTQRDDLLTEIGAVGPILAAMRTEEVIRRLGGDATSVADQAFAADLVRPFGEVPAEEVGVHLARQLALHQATIRQKVTEDFHREVFNVPLPSISEGLETPETRMAKLMERELALDESPTFDVTLDDLRKVGAPKAARVGDLRRAVSSEFKLSDGLTGSNGKPIHVDDATGARERFEREQAEEAARMRQVAGR
jgi:hypothetical protein